MHKIGCWLLDYVSSYSNYPLEFMNFSFSTLQKDIRLIKELNFEPLCGGFL